MKVSVNWIKQYFDFELPPLNELVEKIGAQLGGVENIENIGDMYKGAIIAKVVECTPHPDSDHMHVCRIDDAGKTADVQRGDDGLVQVVCGAPNVRAGLTVVWLPPGSTVPESYGKDAFVLGARELRGVTSNGMLASSRELAIGDNHDGIAEVEATRTPGTSFADAYQLDDTIIDIENKMFTHRPDCFGQLGVAREVAGILGKQFTSPVWYQNSDLNQLLKGSEALPLTVQNELPNLVPRFMAVALSGVSVGPSPLELQTWLSRLGVRPISNIVDVTNYIMLLTGQPLHAYDYDKVKALSGDNGPTIVVRNPRANEQIALLNGKTIMPRTEAIMIATDQKLIGVGGAMGGSETEVDADTKNIILEVGTFDMYSIRRTSMAHGLFSEAVTRFNKGQSPLQNDEVLAYSMQAIAEISGAQVASEVIDNDHVSETSRERRWVHPPVPITIGFINARLGFALTPDAVKVLLENVEFLVSIEGEILTVTAPFWRTDVETREDVVEEVGRMYGFDKLPLELPLRSVKPGAKDQSLELKAKVRANLAKCGANEVLNYSFVHGDLLNKVGQDKELAFGLSNALSPDLQYYRLSITPSLLAEVHPNQKSGYANFALFELGKVHSRTEIDEAGLPKEYERLAVVYVGSAAAGAAYYGARHYLTQLLAAVPTSKPVQLVPFSAALFEGHVSLEQMVQPFEPGRSAFVSDGERVVGIVGEYRAAVRKSLKLPEFTAGFELYLSALAVNAVPHYTSLSRFPSVTQDITLKVPADLAYQELYNFLQQQIKQTKPQQTVASLEALDNYQSPDDTAHKHVTFRLSIASYEKTMTDREVTTLLALVANAAKDKFVAEQL